MADRRWKKVFRDLWLNKARSLLVILAIATSLTGAGTVLNAWALVDRATDEGFRASNPRAGSVYTDSIDDAVLDLVRAVAGVRDVQARRTITAAAQVEGSIRTAMLFSMRDFRNAPIGRIDSMAGEWPPGDGDIVVEQSSVNFTGASIGSTITLSNGDRSIELATSGFARDVGLAPGWMEHIVYAFVTPATIARLGANSSFNELQFTVNSASTTRADVRRVAAAIQTAIESTGRTVHNVDVPEPGDHIHAAQMDSLLFTQGAFGVLALVVSAFLVVNLLSAMLSAQLREIGVMKTIGAKTAQLIRMYLAFAIILGALSTVVAVPLSMLLGRQYGMLRAELLNFDASSYAIPWWAIALQVVVGLLIPLLAALPPVLMGCRTTIAAALRDVGIAHDGRESSSLLLSRLGLSRPLALSIRNAMRKRQRMILTMLVIASGGAVFVGSRNLRAGVIDALDIVFESQRYAFAVRLDAPHAVDSIERAVAAVSGVSGAEAWAGARAAVAFTDGTVSSNFPITAPPAATRLLAPRVLSGRWARETGNELVVNSSMSRQEEALAVGNEVALIINGRQSSWTVVGVVESGPTPMVYAAREAILRLNGTDAVSSIVVANETMPGGAQLDLIQRVRSTLETEGMAVSSTQLLEENRRVVEDHLLMVVQFLGVMGWVMIVIGGMALSSTMSLAVLERTREIGVMRAIGAGHGAILRMIQAEGFAIALAGWLVALPLSIPISAVLAYAFSRIMLPVPVRWFPEPNGLVQWLAVVIFVSLLSCTWPAIRAMRVSVRTALAYE